MTVPPHPILYSFRRCPYAMRARLAIKISGVQCELREVVLRDKPADMIAASPKATVPVLIEPDGNVVDESFDIMLWALEQHDPERWLAPEHGDRLQTKTLISRIEGPFKHHLDRYKYAPRYAHENEGAGVDARQHRREAMAILNDLEQRLARHAFLCGARRSLADAAIAPFIRQFCNVDQTWFVTQGIPHVQRWLTAFLASDLFVACMVKYARWEPGTVGVSFPGEPVMQH